MTNVAGRPLATITHALRLFALTKDATSGADTYQAFVEDLLAFAASHVFDVRRWAPDAGDGSDITDALLAAVDAAETNGFGVVWVPGGHYQYAETVEIASPRVGLMGAGIGRVASAPTVDGTLLEYTGSGTAISVTASGHNHLAGFHLDGASAADDTHGIVWRYESDTTGTIYSAKRIFASGFDGDAYRFRNIEKMDAVHLTAYQAGGVGFYFDADGHATDGAGISNRFAMCRALECGSYGWDIGYQAGSVFDCIQALHCGGTGAVQVLARGTSRALTFINPDIEGKFGGTDIGLRLVAPESQMIGCAMNDLATAVEVAFASDEFVVVGKVTPNVTTAVSVDANSSDVMIIDPSGGTINDAGTRTAIISPTKLKVAQGSAIADASDEASAIARLNDLLAFLRTRGDIAT